METMAVQNLARVLLDDALDSGLTEAVAIREPKRVWSYVKLAQEAGRAGSALRGLGLQPGDRVALLLHDSAELAAIFIGAIRVGILPVPLSILLKPIDVRDAMRDAGAQAVVTSADLASIVDEVRAELPLLQHHLAVGGALAGQTDFHALTRDSDQEAPLHQPGDDEPAFILYSAGGAEVPRGVPHRHAASLHAFESYARPVLQMTSGDCVFSTARLSTAFGLGLGLLFPLLARAAGCLLPARPRPRAVFDVLAACRPTIFGATPSLYGQMLHDYKQVAAPRPEYFACVRHAVSGGEALPEPLARKFQQVFGKKLLHGFGATEALHFVLSNRPGEEREGSAGRVLPPVEARIVNWEGKTLAPQEIGVLELQGPQLSSGYWGQAAREGWLRTGDKFFVDDDGYYFYCGRGDDLFKVSGRWVAPGEIEETLLRHPAVWECAVVEGHDEDGLAQPVAYVVPNVGHDPSEHLATDLQIFVKKEIAPYKYPRQVLFVETLPKGKDGRVQRWKLRAPA
jgi:benzoate-CoA ligase family protein